ncbi:AIPR family protein [Nocardia grenadensis]
MTARSSGRRSVELVAGYRYVSGKLFQPAHFGRNIRNALGRTAVNEALVTTLRQEPHHFWYFNNGITVLAERIGRAARDSHGRTNGLFRLFGATVVNLVRPGLDSGRGPCHQFIRGSGAETAGSWSSGGYRRTDPGRRLRRSFRRS